MAKIVGILNLTADSFSDGGAFLDPTSALRHAETMRMHGADWIDVGAEASNPDAQRIDAETEIARLTPIVRALVKDGARVSVDTYKAAVMRAMIDLGATMINDITALSDPHAASVLAKAPDVKLVLMHARNAGPIAERERRGVGHHGKYVGDIIRYLQARITVAEAAGIGRDRLIVDPGMGLFLDVDREASVAVLTQLATLQTLDLPIYVCTSRKSFIGAILGGRAKHERAFGTLATELFALHHGASYIRTHDPGAVKDAWTVWSALSPEERR